MTPFADRIILFLKISCPGSKCYVIANRGSVLVLLTKIGGTNCGHGLQKVRNDGTRNCKKNTKEMVIG